MSLPCHMRASGKMHGTAATSNPGGLLPHLVATQFTASRMGSPPAAAFQRAPTAPEIMQASCSYSTVPTASLRRAHHRRRLAVLTAAAAVAEPPAPSATRQADVLNALSNVIDPDFGEDIVKCGFVKDLVIDSSSGDVAFTLELTTPACPVKEMFQRQSTEFVKALPWVRNVSVKMTAQPRPPVTPDSGRPGGLAKVAHIIAVSSCKGGVGKSTVSVNLAYTLAQMGAKVGIFDADVYGPSLPLMVSPASPVLEMNAETKAIYPTEYEGVKAVSFGFAGKGSAIMRGPMVSGLIQQLLVTAEWGELDYLVVDFPPGTGDIQLTLCQTVAFSAAVIVTTPQRMAFIDVAKGIRMFAKLMVPAVAVVENMAYFDAPDGSRHYPFGAGSGAAIQRDFAVPNLLQFPIVADLSAAGDGGRPLVVSQPTCATAAVFMELGAAVVQEVAKMRSRAASVYHDPELEAIVVRLPGAAGAGAGSEEFLLHPALLRRRDTSATSINEWTGQRMVLDEDIPEDIVPMSINPLGNYAVQITWTDGFNQVASFEQLEGLRNQAIPRKQRTSNTGNGNGAAQSVSTSVAGLVATVQMV